MNKVQRPPIVAVVGHIDHGKTTLLDTIRKSNIAQKEKGGITQHIGAYQISHKDKKITFIDTPGHAFFQNLRSRGTRASDIAILVVAADEGVKPQTKEAIKYTKEAKIPMIVAINKIDLLDIDVKACKKQLSENGVLLEGYGGDVVSQEVSAKEGKGISELLDMIILISEMEGLKSNSELPLEAIIIESYLDRKRGPVASIIVKSGTLKIGDEIEAGTSLGKVKSMIDDRGKKVSEALPADPIEILGLKSVPKVGVVLTHLPKIEKRAPELAPPPLSPLKRLAFDIVAREKFKVVIKADVKGSLEAILDNLPTEVAVVFSDVGEISEADVMMARSANAPILSFNVLTSKKIQELADSEKVIIRSYKLIYELIDDLVDVMKSRREEKDKEKIIKEAQIIAEFKIGRKKIAGCKVISGDFEIGAKVQVLRGKTLLGESKITSIKQTDKSIKIVHKGEECGILLSPELDFQIGDRLQLAPHK